MWAVTDKFLNALRGPHRTSTVVTVLEKGEVVSDPIPVVSGSLTRDRRAENYGRLSVVVGDPDLAPLTRSAQLGPAGFELQLSRGLVFADGTEELVPLGIFPIQTSDVDGVDMSTSIEAVDRSQRVVDALLETDQGYGPGHSAGVVAAFMIQQGVPDAEFLASIDFGVGGRVHYEAGSDPWAIAQDIARSNGGEIYFDGLGRCVFRAEPDALTTSPVWTIDEGDTGVLIDVDISWSRRPTHNRVIVTGTNQEFGVTYRGIATDNVPSSPSYYDGGRFGHKPLFHFSPHVTSNAGASQWHSTSPPSRTLRSSRETSSRSNVRRSD
jgi:hypothetical protein